MALTPNAPRMVTSVSPPDSATVSVLIKLALSGALLLALSVPIHETGYSAYLKVFLRELGIVLLAVFSISLIYEVWLFEKYQHRFLAALTGQIERGETNAANCEYLGIRRIFRSRHEFERQHPFHDLVKSIDKGGSLRVVGRSLFGTTTQVAELRAALERSARIELCLLDPKLGADDLRTSPDVDPGDITAALGVLKIKLIPRLATDSVPGEIEVRCHRIHLLDSFMQVTSSSSFCVWELTFGRDLGESKRLLMLDPSKGLGHNLRGRYQLVWDQARPIFHWKDGKVTVDELSTLISSSGPQTG